jgi:hypothetical protein
VKDRIKIGIVCGGWVLVGRERVHVGESERIWLMCLIYISEIEQ